MQETVLWGKISVSLLEMSPTAHAHNQRMKRWHNLPITKLICWVEGVSAAVRLVPSSESQSMGAPTMITLLL